MNTIFEGMTTGVPKRPSADVQAWLRSVRNAQTAGVLSIANPEGDAGVLFLYRGSWFFARASTSDGFDPVDPANELPPTGSLIAKFAPLSTYGLIHAALLSRAQHRTHAVPPQALMPSWSIENPNGKPASCLVTLKWNDAAGSILYHGVSELPHTLYYSGNIFLDELGIPEAVRSRLGDTSCAAVLYAPDPSLDAWREVLLRRAFKSLCDHMLNRIEMITGRAIVDSFTRIMGAIAANHNLDIMIRSRRLVNQEFFHTSRRAAEKYQLILKEFLEHFSAVIGPRLLASNLRDIYAELSVESREILNSYNVLPNGYIS